MLVGSATFDAHTYARSGTFQITITATDNSGYSTRASSQWLTVSPPLSAPAAQAPTILGLAPIEFYSLIGIIAGIIVTATFLTFRRLKKPASRQPLLRLENRPE